MGDPGPYGAAGGGHTVHPRAPQKDSDGSLCVGKCTELLYLSQLCWSLDTQPTGLHIYG